MPSLCRYREIVLDSIAPLRQRLIEDLGPAGVHALEDGLALGAVVGLWVTFPVVAVALTVGLGASPKRASLLAVLPELVGMVRSEDARRQESYFIGGVVGGAIVGHAVGSLLRLGARLSGVAVPTTAELLNQFTGV